MFGSLGTVSCQNDPTMPQHRPKSGPILGAATASSVPGATESFAHVPRVLMATNPGGEGLFQETNARNVSYLLLPSFYTQHSAAEHAFTVHAQNVGTAE